MDPIKNLEKAIGQTGAIVASVKPDDLGKPTPCTEFDVRALTNHLVGAVQMFGAAARGETYDLANFGNDLVGDDPAGAYDKAAAELREAVAKPDVLDQTWAMPFGPTPGGRAVGIATMETLQHGWDIARGTGQQPDYDADLYEAALATGKEFLKPEYRQPGVFGPEVPCPGDAPAADRLAAFLGRTP